MMSADEAFADGEGEWAKERCEGEGNIKGSARNQQSRKMEWTYVNCALGSTSPLLLYSPCISVRMLMLIQC